MPGPKQNLDEFLKIMESHTNSSNNTVFADGAGNIAYLHSNFVPGVVAIWTT